MSVVNDGPADRLHYKCRYLLAYSILAYVLR